MAKMRGGMEHTMVSNHAAITTEPSIYYGCTVVNATTAGVQAAIFDATATAQEVNPVDMVTVVAGTNNNNGVFYPPGVIMHSGIFVSAIVCTAGADQIIVFYGGV